MFKKKLHQHLISAIAEMGYVEPTEFQKLVIPKIKSGSDLLCVAKDDSGKTTTIVLGVIQNLNNSFDDVPRAIIVVSSYEKGEEMLEQFNLLGKNTDLRVYNARPNFDLQKQKEKIYFGMDIVIGTAQLLNDLFSINAVNINGLKMFIIDDADIVFRPENLVRIDRLASCIPKSQQLVFAKSITERTNRFLERYMSNALIVEMQD